jgi:Holliday junction resolvase
MERRITEEQVTKAILNWLESNNWKIITFDFPQSGTGYSLHPNENLRTTKNKGAFIPDIVAIKSETVVFFENKDRFVLSDFQKVEELKSTQDFTKSIEKLLKEFSYSKLFYGVGLAHSDKTELKTYENLDKIDFAVFLHQDSTIKITFDPNKIFVKQD